LIRIEKSIVLFEKTVMELRSRRPLRVQGDAGHPSEHGGGQEKNNWKKWRAEEEERRKGSLTQKHFPVTLNQNGDPVLTCLASFFRSVNKSGFPDFELPAPLRFDLDVPFPEPAAREYFPASELGMYRMAERWRRRRNPNCGLM
jgi:hypothetical protein